MIRRLEAARRRFSVPGRPASARRASAAAAATGAASTGVASTSKRFKYLWNAKLGAGPSVCGLYAVRMEANYAPADASFKRVRKLMGPDGGKVVGTVE